MFQISVTQLYETNREKLKLAWVGGQRGGGMLVHRDTADAPALIGNLNLIHPNCIQIIGAIETRHLASFDDSALRQMLNTLFASRPAAIIHADGVRADWRMLAAAEATGTAVFSSSQPGADIIDQLRRYLSKTLADTVTLHGVCMDVLGVGVLITGDSGVGKSELGLELISRGHGLVADDAVEISRIATTTLECRCPPMLKDFIEVRGLGFLNIRTIFGETAVRPKMKLRLIVHLEKPAQGSAEVTERLPLHELSEDILGMPVRKVVIPVTAGRNLAVLLEAAVRSHVLQLRGINTTAEFIARQKAEMRKQAT